jgi:hypothetical protein
MAQNKPAPDPRWLTLRRRFSGQEIPSYRFCRAFNQVRQFQIDSPVLQL